MRNNRKYDLVALGEVFAEFAPAGKADLGTKLFEQTPGGAPANMLSAVRKAGLNTAFIGKVGNDMHGLFLKDTLENAGIDSTGLVIDNDVFTTLAFVSLTETGEKEFSFARKPGADTRLCFKEIDLELLKQAKVFHVGSLSLTDEPVRTATYEALKLAKAAGTMISYAPNYTAPLWESKDIAIERMCSMIPYADMIKISEEETSLLTPYNAPEEAAEYLIKQGIKAIAVTLGSRGALICNSMGTKIVPGFKSTVSDTTGAGAVFWGGFISRYLKCKEDLDKISLEELVKFAIYGNAAACLYIEKGGGISGIPEEEEVLRRADTYMM